jgi:hypothetical protein
MKKDVEQMKRHNTAKVNNFLEMWQVAGQSKPTCYAEGISRSKHADDCHWIHFGHGNGFKSIHVTHST